jgi:hypothetical protein
MTHTNDEWRMLIDGEWVERLQWREVINLATGEPIEPLPEAAPEDHLYYGYARATTRLPYHASMGSAA